MNSHHTRIDENTTFSFDGIGVHSGEHCRVTLHHENILEKTTAHKHRVVFVNNGQELPATPQFLQPQNRRATRLAIGSGGLAAGTVEHLLFATHFFGEKWTVEIDGPEVPILDGSALPFMDAFSRADIPKNRRFHTVPNAIRISKGNSHVDIQPCPGGESPVYSVNLVYPPPIGDMSYRHSPNAEDFPMALAPARTFALESEVATLRKTGLALGGDLDCALVIGNDGPLNKTGMRFPNEPARHKMLDFIGDMALLESLPWAHIRIVRPGHQLNYEIIDFLKKSKR